MAYLQAVIGLIQIVNWVMSKLDDAAKAKALAAMWDQEFMRRDKEILDAAIAARAALEQRLRDNPDELRLDDGFERKP